MSPLESTVSREAVTLCREYIYHRLQSLGLFCKRRNSVRPAVFAGAAFRVPCAAQLFLRPLPANPMAVRGAICDPVCDIVGELQLASANFQKLHPGLFRDVAGQLNIRLTSKEVVGEALTAVASEIIAAGITWARVVAAFAVAGSLAAECMQRPTRDQAIFVDQVIRSLTIFVRERLVSWVAEQGGWGDLAITFRSIKDDNSTVLMTIGLLGAVCGVIATILATGTLPAIFQLTVN